VKKKLEKKHKLEITLENITVLQNLLEDLEVKGKIAIRLTNTERLNNALSAAIDALNIQLLLTYQSNVKNREWRKPESKIKPNSVHVRKMRDKKVEKILPKIKSYLEELNKYDID
jgi:hypothetical protein